MQCAPTEIHGPKWICDLHVLSMHMHMCVCGGGVVAKPWDYMTLDTSHWRVYPACCLQQPRALL